MRIRVNYSGFLSATFHRSSEDLHLSNKAKLRDLLLRLGERYRDKLEVHNVDQAEAMVKSEGVEEGSLVVLLNVNGISSRQLQGLETELKDGDVVDVMPMFSGGG